MDGEDNKLALKAAIGDRMAFDALMRRNYEGFRRLAWRTTGNRDAADDVAQDVCVKIAGAISRFRADSAFKTWAYRIVYNTAIDHIRVSQRSEPTEPSQMEQLIDTDEAGNSPEASMLAAEVWAEVRKLPDQQRDAVLLVYGQDMSHAEAAEILGCTANTVSWHLHEARKRLKSVLEPAA